MNLKNLNSMPNVDPALQGWFSTISMVVITQSNVKGLLETTRKTVKFEGVVQPLQAEKIQLKPEGQRSFKWLQIHTVVDNPLKTDDRIEYGGEKYKIMGKYNYEQNGFIEYHCIEDFQNGV